MRYTIINDKGNEIRLDFDFSQSWTTLDNAIADIANFDDWASADLDQDFRETYDIDGDTEKLSEWEIIWLDDSKQAWTVRRTSGGIDVQESGWVGEYREYFTREGYESMVEDGDDIDRALKVVKAEKLSGFSKYPSTMAGIWETMRKAFGDGLGEIVSDLNAVQLGNMLRLAKVAYSEGKEAGR